MNRLITADKVSFHAIGLSVWVMEKPQPKCTSLAPLPLGPAAGEAEIGEAIVQHLVTLELLPGDRRKPLGVMLARYLIGNLKAPWRLSGTEIVAYLTGKMSASEVLFFNVFGNASCEACPRAERASCG